MTLRMSRTMICVALLLPLTLNLCGCESSDDSDESQDAATNAPPAQEPTRHAQPASTNSQQLTIVEMLAPYFGDWSGSVAFEFEGTEYSLSITKVRIELLSGEDVSVSTSASLITRTVDGSVKYIIDSNSGVGPGTSDRWDSTNRTLILLAHVTDPGGPLHPDTPFTISFSSDTQAQMTFSELLGGFTLPLTKGP